MDRNDHYWVNREARAKVAHEHTAYMESRYQNETKNSIEQTEEYRHSSFPCYKSASNHCLITVEAKDSVAAIFQSQINNSKIAVLNFASFKNPGGAFLKGSNAQEECLCHESNLYNVISAQKEFYETNNMMLNRSLYHNRGLYSPGIVFERNGESCVCDVITVAAPNKFTAQKYCCVSDEENTETLFSRIRFVLTIAANNRVSTLILGAYGCGVFGQDPAEVAGIFNELLHGEFDGCFARVIFAIPDGPNGNLNVFRSVFGEKQEASRSTTHD